VALLLAYNHAIYGSPFQFGYPTAAEGGRNLNSFHTPMWRGLFGYLLSPGKSVFLFAPPIVAALFGIRLVWIRNRGLCVLAAGSLPVYLLFFCKLTNWEGGYCFGPRYMVPAIALLCLALAPAIDGRAKRFRIATIALGAAGFAVQLIGMATSFLEDQATTGRYYDPNWSYRLSYSWRGQFDLLMQYLNTTQPAPLGRGFDRWFVFLAKAGIPEGTILGIAAVMLAGLALSAMKLRRSLEQSSI
jgi:hypothetical protein